MSRESVHFNITVRSYGGDIRDENRQAVKPVIDNQGHLIPTPLTSDDMIVRHDNRRSPTYNTKNWRK